MEYFLYNVESIGNLDLPYFRCFKHDSTLAEINVARDESVSSGDTMIVRKNEFVQGKKVGIQMFNKKKHRRHAIIKSQASNGFCDPTIYSATLEVDEGIRGVAVITARAEEGSSECIVDVHLPFGFFALVTIVNNLSGMKQSVLLFYLIPDYRRNFWNGKSK